MNEDWKVKLYIHELSTKNFVPKFHFFLINEKISA